MQNGHSNGGHSLGGLVDMAAGTVSREILSTKTFMLRSKSFYSHRAWLSLVMCRRFPNPSDYFVSCMGEESVILCRDREGEIHVFLNSAPTGG